MLGSAYLEKRKKHHQENVPSKEFDTFVFARVVRSQEAGCKTSYDCTGSFRPPVYIFFVNDMIDPTRLLVPANFVYYFHQHWTAATYVRAHIKMHQLRGACMCANTSGLINSKSVNSFGFFEGRNTLSAVSLIYMIRVQSISIKFKVLSFYASLHNNQVST